ncbi:MAG: heme-binding protein [Methylotenera sp.]|nr:heme-binding protein [Methylotenera sp.]
MKHLAVLLSLLTLLLSVNTAMATEESKYTLIEKDGAFELRAYDSKLIAEVLVDGDMSDASSKGFRLIADYIFGNNTAASGKSEKINMTAPVGMEARPEKIAMTVPVAMQMAQQGWKVWFVMPSHYTLATLPKPNNPLVVIKPIAAKRYAVLRFSGWVDDEKMQAKLKDLSAWLAVKKLTSKGQPELARYNPPWTLPFLRRNEVMLEITSD